MNFREPLKNQSPGNLFLKKGTNPVHIIIFPFSSQRMGPSVSLLQATLSFAATSAPTPSLRIQLTSLRIYCANNFIRDKQCGKKSHQKVTFKLSDVIKIAFIDS